MDKHIYDDKNGLWYELQGDYYIPCLILPAEKEQPIGLWGQRHLRYLKEYRRNTYTTLLTSGRLNTYLADIDKQAQERMERLTEQMGVCKGNCRKGNYLCISKRRQGEISAANFLKKVLLVTQRNDVQYIIGGR